MGGGGVDAFSTQALLLALKQRLIFSAEMRVFEIFPRSGCFITDASAGLKSSVYRMIFRVIIYWSDRYVLYPSEHVGLYMESPCLSLSQHTVFLITSCTFVKASIYFLTTSTYKPDNLRLSSVTSTLFPIISNYCIYGL
jgi:hypothetical protein